MNLFQLHTKHKNLQIFANYSSKLQMGNKEFFIYYNKLKEKILLVVNKIVKIPNKMKRNNCK